MTRFWPLLLLAACAAPEAKAPETVDPDLASAALCGREQEDVFSGARAALSPECQAFFEANWPDARR